MDVSRYLKPNELDHYGTSCLKIEEDDEEFYIISSICLEDDEVDNLSSQLSNLSSGPSQGSQQEQVVREGMDRHDGDDDGNGGGGGGGWGGGGGGPQDGG